ncbi:hypothetical protein PR048_022001 [Dryococelus australis]|uniref:Uncharacterized protein n=1 Tax=Dryococelus australis TaxID=614101 RepID=A0ABQ9GZS1_9NEOP|nr:hypothetical protein PR048_022001 [Dryococelus australis]
MEAESTDPCTRPYIKKTVQNKVRQQVSCNVGFKSGLKGRLKRHGDCRSRASETTAVLPGDAISWTLRPARRDETDGRPIKPPWTAQRGGTPESRTRRGMLRQTSCARAALPTVHGAAAGDPVLPATARIPRSPLRTSRGKAVPATIQVPDTSLKAKQLGRTPLYLFAIHRLLYYQKLGTRIKKSTAEEERLQVAVASVAIIGEDIRSSIVETKSYPSPSRMLDDINEEIPKTLLNFLQKVIIKK